MPRLSDGNSGRWSSGFKTDGEEQDVTFGLGPGDVECIADRIHHPHISTTRLGLEQGIAAKAGNTQQITEATQDQIFVFHQMNRSLQAPAGKYADWTTGTMNQANLLWQQIFNSIAADGMGMAATEFHQRIPPFRFNFASNACGQPLR